MHLYALTCGLRHTFACLPCIRLTCVCLTGVRHKHSPVPDPFSPRACPQVLLDNFMTGIFPPHFFALGSAFLLHASLGGGRMSDTDGRVTELV